MVYGSLLYYLHNLSGTLKLFLNKLKRQTFKTPHYSLTKTPSLWCDLVYPRPHPLSWPPSWLLPPVSSVSSHWASHTSALLTTADSREAPTPTQIRNTLPVLFPRLPPSHSSKWVEEKTQKEFLAEKKLVIKIKTKATFLCPQLQTGLSPLRLSPSLRTLIFLCYGPREECVCLKNRVKKISMNYKVLQLSGHTTLRS